MIDTFRRELATRMRSTGSGTRCGSPSAAWLDAVSAGLGERRYRRPAGAIAAQEA